MRTGAMARARALANSSTEPVTSIAPSDTNTALSASVLNWRMNWSSTAIT
jgi:hypothetical protein